jgi:cytochrome c peroxidase
MHKVTSPIAAALATALTVSSFATPSGPPAPVPSGGRLPDPTGTVRTYADGGPIDTRGAFFQSLGTNGRTCATCHVIDEGMGLSAAGARARFQATRGADPLFAPVDGANCPNARSTNAADHSLLLESGLFRIALTPPASSQFSISLVHDPYGCATVPDGSGQAIVSVYRRPLPSTNLNFLSAVMSDGRETLVPLASGATFRNNLIYDLTDQANSAINGHAQAVQSATPAQLADIVNFELSLYTAQESDLFAGNLAGDGALGGAYNVYLSKDNYYPGVNDALGADPEGNAFNPAAMSLFSSWSKLTYADVRRPEDWVRITARKAIAAGEELFNNAPINITNVRGLNDNAALGKPKTIVGHCSTCHDAPNVGDHSLPLPLDIGTGHASLPGMESDPRIQAALAQLSMPNLPVYLISGCPDPFGSGEPASFYTTDAGKALITGQCSDVNRVKGPILRGLASRAPYFHNGAAANLLEVVNFYNERFEMGLSDVQKLELVAFLNSL